MIEEEGGHQIVLGRIEAEKRHKIILDRNNIPAERSPELVNILNDIQKNAFANKQKYS